MFRKIFFLLYYCKQVIVFNVYDRLWYVVQCTRHKVVCQNFKLSVVQLLAVCHSSPPPLHDKYAIRLLLKLGKRLITCHLRV